jgi:TfoX/Sxy family transcriptional regulator of competence genes
MAMDDELAGRVRSALADAPSVREVRMFGGLGFMLNGNMVAACSPRGLLVRVGEAGMAEALSLGAQPMVMNGRTMKGFVRIDGSADGRAVKSWLRRARAFVETLPAKAGSTARKGKKQ